MVKKFLSLSLALILSFCFCACGGSDTDGKKDTSSKDKTSSVSSPSSSTTTSTVSKPKKDQTLWTRKMVALTFDDSPFNTTGALLDLLKEKNVKASFFMIGQHMEEYPEIVERAVNEGHDVGWHSYAHDINNSSPEGLVAQDFDKAQSIMDGICPEYKITLYRGPGGSSSPVMIEQAKKRDWRLINWTNYGFKDSSKEVIAPADRMAGIYATSNGAMLRNGEIVLIHPYEGCTDTITGIGLFIDKLRADGYEPVAMSELLKRRNGGLAGTVYNAPLY